MPKGEDALRRKKNKIIRKKMRRDTDVSSRIAGIIASKQRRKAGKRRMCEGMCFSLPTPEDPFNDRNTEKALNKKKDRKLVPPQEDAGRSLTKQGSAPGKDLSGRNSLKGDVEKKNPRKGKVTNGKYNSRIDSVKTTSEMQGKVEGDHIKEPSFHGKLYDLSKVLKLCLHVIEKALVENGIFKVGEYRPLLSDTWGYEFLKSWQCMVPILETTGACFSTEQIAWIVSVAVNSIKRREDEGLPVTTPFLLILVATQEKALQVRSVCKPLKALGIHTVSLHSGASLDHQIRGLKSCEPEFLVSTPERLLELISLKAIDITKLSILVVDGLETFAKSSSLDTLTSIRQFINEEPVHEEPRTIVFFDDFGTHYTSAVQNLVSWPICRLSLNDSLASQSACITQCVHVCASEERVSKSLEIYNQQVLNRVGYTDCNVLFVEGTSSNARSLTASLRAEGCSNIEEVFSDCSEAHSREKIPTAVVTDLEHVGKVTDSNDMRYFTLVFILRCAPSIDDYVKILTRMARASLDAELHIFLGEEDAPLAGPLIDILNQCGQTVPDSLRKLCPSSSVLEIC